MATEIKAGDVLSYTVFSASESEGATGDFWGSVASWLAGQVANNATVVDQASGPYSFSLRLKSLVDRGRVSDFKYDLDNALTTGQNLHNLATTLDFISQVPRTGTPAAPGQNQNQGQPTPPGQNPQFIKDLATSLGMTEQTVWMILVVGAVALLFSMKR